MLLASAHTEHLPQFKEDAMKGVLVMVAFTVFLSGCVVLEERGPGAKQSGPPPWAPAHGHRAKHVYQYYPAVGVYYDVSTRMYFYLNGGTWQVAASLPPSIAIAGIESVSVELETDKPYLYHDKNLEQFKGKKGKGKGKGHGKPF
jgi:hypothetical protein